MATTADLLAHAREFTDIENTTLDAWLQAENANLDIRAAELLDAGLMAEHFTSLLDNDATKRTPDQLVMLSQLRAKLADQVRMLENELHAKAWVTGKAAKPFESNVLTNP